jgi:hypothetical protein
VDSATRDKTATEGAIYLPTLEVAQQLPAWNWTGQAWEFNGRISSYMPNSRVIYKSIDKLAPESEQDFQNIMSSCKKNGIGYPSSFADVFHSFVRSPLPVKSSLTGIRGFQFGGWQEALFLGHVKQKIYHYDLNQAYRWAASVPLPDIREAVPAKDFHDGEYGVYVIQTNELEIPYDQEAGVKVITAEERDRWKLKNRPILSGVKFNGTISLKETWDKIQRCFPYCFRRIGRAFWGRWSACAPVVCRSWKHGPKSRLLNNFLYNPFWPAYITSRVKMRMANEMGHSLHIFVDAILSVEEMATSEEVGGFKLVDVYDDLTICGPGQWGTRGYFVKQCGVKREQPNPIQFANQ